MTMKWLFNQCRQHEASISLLAVGGLTQAEQSRVEAHLAACPACQARFEELKALAGHGDQLGLALPQVEPPVALHRRWMAAVREAADSRNEIKTAPLADLLPGRRLAWSGLAAMWVLVLFFRFSAPDAPRPAASLASTPPSLRAVLLVLKVEGRESPTRADGPFNLPQKPEALPPRSQRPGAAATVEMEGA
jgi:anti-sigma factor RsiW